MGGSGIQKEHASIVSNLEQDMLLNRLVPELAGQSESSRSPDGGKRGDGGDGVAQVQEKARAPLNHFA